MRDLDFAAQKDLADGICEETHPLLSGHLCGGFFACRANDKTLALWKDIKEYCLKNKSSHDQRALNFILNGFKPYNKNNKYGIKWDYFPFEFYGPGPELWDVFWKPGMKLQVPENILVHHANWAIGVKNKIRQMKYVKKVIEQKSKRQNRFKLPGPKTMRKVVVVIPAHLPRLTKYEEVSLLQCSKILSKYPIKLVVPDGLNTDNYKKIIPDIDIKYISSKWFRSIHSYNSLKKALFFYNEFKSYEYLLTYELDSFVFRDELAKWCDMGYDYIGAPWLEGYESAATDSSFIGVGNSGFSLRKVTSCIEAQKGMSVLEKLRHSRNKTSEDIFWCKYIKEKYKWFKIAPVEAALKFSFEVQPEKMFILNNKKLPFGCHAWARYGLLFWKSHINSFGYDI
jgi:hypothetical protein